jgi:hypothetical protein
MASTFVSSAIAELNHALALSGPLTPESAPDALALVYESLARIPTLFLQSLQQLSEAPLHAAAMDRADALLESVPQVVAPPSQALEAAFILLRALEQYALQFVRFIEADDDPGAAWRTSDGRHYVIPHVRGSGGLDGKPFLRRALLHHRILPTEVGGLAVKLYRTAVLATADAAAKDREAGASLYGAAFVPNLRVHRAFGDRP